MKFYGDIRYNKSDSEPCSEFPSSINQFSVSENVL